MGHAESKKLKIVFSPPNMAFPWAAFTAKVAQEEGKKLKKDFLKDEARISITEGGAERFHSVQNGLKLVTDPSVVFVHDGVRCMVTTDLIHRCYDQAVARGSAIPAVAATDSLRVIDGDAHSVIPRSSIRNIQTPQTFMSTLLLPAFDTDYREAFTDEATVVEASGRTVYLIDGEYSNIKITRPADLLAAEQMLRER